MKGLIIRQKGPANDMGLSLAPGKRPLKVPYDEEQLRGMLMRFDTNKDGRLSKEELRAAFKYLGSRAPGVRAFLARFRVDKNCNGYIDNGDEYDVLVKYVTQIGYTII